jgi:hypothetical protein
MNETTTAGGTRIFDMGSDLISEMIPLKKSTETTRKKKKEIAEKRRKKLEDEQLMNRGYDALFKIHKDEHSEYNSFLIKEKEEKKRLELKRLDKENKEFTGLEKSIDANNEIVGTQRVFFYRNSDVFQSTTSRKQYKNIVKILKIAEKVFNESFYDFDIVTDFMNNTFRILFHYPEVELQNTMNDKVYLFDLYVSGMFTFNSSIMHFSRLNGIRTTFSLDEIESSYSHSHLQSSIFNMQKFCLGNGTPLKELYSKNIEYTKTPDQQIFDYWLSYLYNVENYISWESLEGGPHKYMEKIKPCPSRLQNVIKKSNLEPKTIYNIACKELHKDNSLIKGFVSNGLLRFSIDEELLNQKIKNQLNNNRIAIGDYIYDLTDEFKTNYSKYEEDYIKERYNKRSVSFDFKMKRIHNIEILSTNKKNTFRSNNIGNINTWNIIMKLEQKIIENILK